ncbi:glycosyltransferase [Aquicoccus sp. SU-CL01552]|uniref:glycosyltransferase n=1 Tax=Aquicoccus sp. SU-CL01552 TaxID=3127656 RepID=UPI00310BAFA6
MSRPRVVHLVDDTTAGGVMRVLDHILTAPEMGEMAQHDLVQVTRGRMSLKRIEADVIVSHLAVSWRALPMLAALRARHPRTPLVHVEHSYTQGFTAANVRRKRRFATLLRLSYRLFDRVVAVSRAQGDWLIRSGAVPAASLRVIRSCVDLSAFRALDPTKGRPRVIGAIGRLDRQKGFDTLIRAFRHLPDPDLSLHVHGEGPERDRLCALAGDDPRIRFMGFATDPVAAMQSVDVVAMPSKWEAYGLVAIEALCAKRCLLINPVDGLTDHIPHGAQAVDDTSEGAWQTALTRLLATPTPQAAPLPDTRFEADFANQWRVLLTDLLQEDPANHRPRDRAPTAGQAPRIEAGG